MMNLTIIGFIVFAVLVCLLGIPYAKKARKKEYDKLMPLIEDPNAVKVAEWINLDAVNGQEFTGEKYYYLTNIKKGLLNSDPVGVALFEPGKYRLTVSSNSNKKYQKVDMDVLLEPGITYQLGCNERGPYLVPDPDPTRYEYKYK